MRTVGLDFPSYAYVTAALPELWHALRWLFFYTWFGDAIAISVAFMIGLWVLRRVREVVNS